MLKTFASKRVSESRQDRYPLLISPGDLNSLNTVFGGLVLATADKVGGDVARRHSGRECVTRKIDSVDFNAPAWQGETLIFRAWINRSWRSSMEIEVEVYAEKLGKFLRPVVSMFFTFVAINSRGKSTPVPPIILETEEEKQRFKEADHRRQRRLLMPTPE